MTPEGYREWTIPKSPFAVQTVSNICGPCNQGWMNDLDVSFELDVAKVASGQPLAMDQERRRQLVRWATKYAACHELQMQSLPYFSHAERNTIRVDGDGTDTALLWATFTPAYEEVFDRMITMSGPEHSKTRVMVSTLAYGQIAFVLLRHDGSDFGAAIQASMEKLGDALGMTVVSPSDSSNLEVPAPAVTAHPYVWCMSSGAQAEALSGPGMQPSEPGK
jgi:hypothetical protein